MKRLVVRVKPNAGSNALEQQSDATWVARVKAPAADGKANAALIAVIAAHFAVPKRAVTIKAGVTARTKLVLVEI